MNILLPLILLSVLINTAAQLLLKQGMIRIGHFDFSWPKLFSIAFQVAANPYIVAGMFCYVASVAVWLLVLSRAAVSYAYPLISLGYITTSLAAWLLFNEPLSPTRILGILVIMAGVFLITRT